MITQRIFHWACSTPDSVAVNYNGTPVSYRAFAQAIAQARGIFAAQGQTGFGYAVLAVRNLFDFWVCSLALRSLGLTTIAIASTEALAVLDLPDIRCVIMSPQENWGNLEAYCEQRGVNLLRIFSVGQPPVDLDPAGCRSPAGGHVLSTSGTTGRQKMVLIDDALDAFFLNRQLDLLKFDQNAIISVFDFPPWTAVGYRWAVAPWMVGGTTVMTQGHEAYKALAYPGLTHAILVPNVLAVALAASPDATPQNDGLKIIVTGGTLSRRQLAEAKTRLTPWIFNWLASTEAGGIGYTLLGDEADLRWHHLVANRVVEIVDDDDRKLPPGAVGRLRVATDDGPAGYLNDDAATREFFRNGFFYSGDLAVMREDGRIALHGRVTDVINIAGNKILPFLVEGRLAERLGVAAVCLFSQPNDFGEEELHVAIETSGTLEARHVQEIVLQEIRGFAGTRVHFMTTLPRSSLGKILRAQVIAHCGAASRSFLSCPPSPSKL